MKSRTQGGFSLIELLIVVTIIGIIASIALPNLLASRRAANEASAQSSMRTISSCEATYLHTAGNNNYADLASLGTQTLTDSVLASGVKSGYAFTINTVAGNPPQYWAYAIPTTTSGIAQSGTRRFAMAEDGVLRADKTLSAPADANEVRSMPSAGN